MALVSYSRINSESDLAKLSVSANVSDRYVYIDSREILRNLPNYRIDRGYQLVRKSSAHVLYLKNNENSKYSVHIENSYDRSRSFKIAIEYDGMLVSFRKQVHAGQYARDLTYLEGDVDLLLENAGKIIKAMRGLKLSQEIKEEIAGIVVKKRGKKLDSVRGINYSSDDAFTFIQTIFNQILEGDLTWVNASGVERQMRPYKSHWIFLNMQRAVWFELQNNYPELKIL